MGSCQPDPMDFFEILTPERKYKYEVLLLFPALLAEPGDSFSKKLI